MKKLFVLATLAGCGGGTHRSTLAVGTTETARDCTYEAPVNVAKLSEGKQSAELVGPGVLVSSCGNGPVEWQVVQATRLAISYTANGQNASVSAFAGEERIDSSCLNADVQLGPDCADVAKLVPAPEDHGMGLGGSCSDTVHLDRLRSGQCTITATAVGLTTTTTLRL